ncbi:hypothetical protein [Tsukamurella spumae]|uniref:Uncharacterized protein n=1 Tax=Tsukamurella spumae TaxID=44753 RepID=A0A846X0W2_9ACTN|nr:hypothetical protein [Tsukamurella spumae]NKY18894.1 hypothetical protein [Tsukamurella spumae]
MNRLLDKLIVGALLLFGVSLFVQALIAMISQYLLAIVIGLVVIVLVVIMFRQWNSRYKG